MRQMRDCGNHCKASAPAAMFGSGEDSRGMVRERDFQSNGLYVRHGLTLRAQAFPGMHEQATRDRAGHVVAR